MTLEEKIQKYILISEFAMKLYRKHSNKYKELIKKLPLIQYFTTKRFDKYNVKSMENTLKAEYSRGMYSILKELSKYQLTQPEEVK